MASPEKNNKHRDESLPGDISGDAVEKKDKKAEMLDRMVRFNALDREKVTAKAKELGIAEAVDNYYLIYDYNKYITGSDAEDTQDEVDAELRTLFPVNDQAFVSNHYTTNGGVTLVLYSTSAVTISGTKNINT